MTRWTVAKAALLIGGWTCVVAAKQPASITDHAAFESAVAAVRADTHNYDKFKEPVETDLIGKSFAISMPVQDGTGGQGLAYFDYKDGKLILNVSPSKAWPRLEGPGEAMPVLIVSENTKMTGKYIGQNAFGVTAEVKNFRNTGSGIAIVSSPKPMPSPTRFGPNSKYLDDTDWWLDLDLPPSEAKAFALNTKAVVQGTYVKLPSGKVGFCESGGVSATIDRPSNYNSEKCFIGAHITRIAFVNSMTATVLKEWTTANSPMLGPELWGGIRAGMNKYQLKAAQPTITNYGSFEANGVRVQVDMQKSVVAKVKVSNAGARGQQIMASLGQKYGQPVVAKCISTLCEGRWRVNTEVDAYLSITGEVTYQLSSDEPSIGFSP